jgi:hypothetical protein
MPAVTGPLDTVNPSNTYATHDDSLGKGGFRVVADSAARLAITSMRRKAGMWVAQADTSEVWSLGNDLLTWSRVDTRAGSTGVIGYAGLLALTGYWDKRVVVVAPTTFGGLDRGLYIYDAASSVAHNGVSVIQPADNPGVGRWIQIL